MNGECRRRLCRRLSLCSQLRLSDRPTCRPISRREPVFGLTRGPVGVRRRRRCPRCPSCSRTAGRCRPSARGSTRTTHTPRARTPVSARASAPVRHPALTTTYSAGACCCRDYATSLRSRARCPHGGMHATLCILARGIYVLECTETGSWRVKQLGRKRRTQGLFVFHRYQRVRCSYSPTAGVFALTCCLDVPRSGTDRKSSALNARERR